MLLTTKLWSLSGSHFLHHIISFFITKPASSLQSMLLHYGLWSCNTDAVSWLQSQRPHRRFRFFVTKSIYFLFISFFSFLFIYLFLISFLFISYVFLISFLFLSYFFIISFLFISYFFLISFLFLIYFFFLSYLFFSLSLSLSLSLSSLALSLSLSLFLLLSLLVTNTHTDDDPHETWRRGRSELAGSVCGSSA